MDGTGEASRHRSSDRTRISAEAAPRGRDRYSGIPVEREHVARQGEGAGAMAESRREAEPGRRAGPTDEAHLSGWQQRALDRSLVEAKRRALNKSNGFVQAPPAVARRDGRASISPCRTSSTVRSSRCAASTRRSRARTTSCSRCSRSTSPPRPRWQRDRMAKHDDPIEQIHVFLTSLWSGKLSPEVVRSLALYNLTLSATRPAELAHALEPQLVVLLEAVERGVASGQVRGTSAVAALPRSCCTRATPRCTRRSSAPATSPPTTSGRSASEA